MKLTMVIIISMMYCSCVNNHAESNFTLPLCDSVTVSYQKNIAPIIKNQCLSCHDSKNHFGGIILDSYQKLKDDAMSGELYESIIFTNDILPKMPKGSALNTCEISQINKWILSGYPQ